MKRVHIFIAVGAALSIAAAAGLAISPRAAEAASGPGFAQPNYERERESKLLDLTRPDALVDRERLLARIRQDALACRDALVEAGMSFTELPPVRATGGCGFGDAVIVQASLAEWSAPRVLPMSCDLAARFHLWERHVVIPAAERHLGAAVAEIEAFGSFQCRRVSGSDHLSQHAFARAVDIAAFRLADGRRISVLDHYAAKDAGGAFLREIHARACEIFDVTLGPGYNADHRNHFHLDVGGGQGFCG